MHHAIRVAQGALHEFLRLAFVELLGEHFVQQAHDAAHDGQRRAQFVRDHRYYVRAESVELLQSLDHTFLFVQAGRHTGYPVPVATPLAFHLDPLQDYLVVHRHRVQEHSARDAHFAFRDGRGEKRADPAGDPDRHGRDSGGLAGTVLAGLALHADFHLVERDRFSTRVFQFLSHPLEHRVHERRRDALARIERDADLALVVCAFYPHERQNRLIECVSDHLVGRHRRFGLFHLQHGRAAAQHGEHTRHHLHLAFASLQFRLSLLVLFTVGDVRDEHEYATGLFFGRRHGQDA